VSGWGAGKHDICSYDIKLDHPSSRDEISVRCEQHGVGVANTIAEALANAELVFSVVTADQAVNAALAATAHLKPNALWCDLNSCAPSSKQSAAHVIEQANAKYVDVAVMAPVYPALNKVPLLLSGPHAAQAAEALAVLPMNVRVIDGPVGAASSIKMLRSVMVKGLEALTAECTLAAVAAGVDKDVFASLNLSHPGSEWSSQAAYNFERSVVHGQRRAAEMEEVSKTLTDLGLPNHMSVATVNWQRRLGELDDALLDDKSEGDASAIASSLLKRLRH